MDAKKCQALKARLAAQPGTPVIAITTFFDGNDDPASIGCNLEPHPGVSAFRDVLTGLLGRSDVEAVYAQVAEVDPGAGSWPFADTVLVVGSISPDELHDAVLSLQPDEVGALQGYAASLAVAERGGSPVLVIFWD
jgi:hypothetical protein